MAVRSVRSSRRSSISLLRVRITFAVGRMAEARIMRIVAVAMSSRYVKPRSFRIGPPRVQEIDRERDVQVRGTAGATVLAQGDGVHGDEMRQGLDPLEEGGDLAVA